MTAHPVPSDFDLRTNAAFEALMWALSRPGLVRELPGPGMEPIVEALIDRECVVHCADPALSALAERLGAAVAGLETADHVFLNEVTETLPDMVRLGSDLYPEDGATVVARADLETGRALRLTGPGIDGAVTVRVGGVPEAFWRARDRAMRYPMGFELFLVDGSRVLGVPRSTKVEVL